MASNFSYIVRSLKKSVSSKKQFPTIRLPPLPSPRDIVRLYKLQARKQLSQNFLLDSKITDRIVKQAGKICGGDVCEVGPGPGSITRSILARNPGRLLVIEKDERFLPSLDLLKEVSRGKMHVTLGDVLLLDMSKMFRGELRTPWEDSCPNIHIIGNLPFNVATPLIIRWLRDISLRQSAWSYGRVNMTLTFQREVAERMVAPANHPQRCRLSVMCQNWCHVKHVSTIAGSAFVPPPDVDVGVVTFQPRVKPIIDEEFYLVEKVIRQIFTHRQKSCITCARTLFPYDASAKYAVEMLRLADLRLTIKPYQLTNEEFLRLVLAYKHICSQHRGLSKYNPHGCSDEMFWLEADKEHKISSETNTESEDILSLETEIAPVPPKVQT